MDAGVGTSEGELEAYQGSILSIWGGLDGKS